MIGPDNELQSDGTWDYAYDAEGNVTSKHDATDTWSYTYDNANQMTSAVETVTSSVDVLSDSEYTYDVFGNRSNSR